VRSAFTPSVSPVQHLHFQKNTDFVSSHSNVSNRSAFAHMPDDDVLVEEIQGDLNGETYEELVARLQEAADHLTLRDAPVSFYPPGDFRYLPQQVSPGIQIQDVLPSCEPPGFFPNRIANNPSLWNNNGYPICLGEANGEMRAADCAFTPTSQVFYDGEGTRGATEDRRATEDSGVVPDRFRQGWESLSVKRNVTIRESKRPKARLSDQEYHRSSMTPSTARQSLGMQFPAQYPGAPVGFTHSVQEEISNRGRNDRVSYSPHESDKDIMDTGANGSRHTTAGTGYDPNSAGYAINLSHAGRLVRHLVTLDTRVTQ
jgi:hypothetical protein